MRRTEFSTFVRRAPNLRGSRLAALGVGNQWHGDGLAAEVVAIELDAINLGSTGLFLRLALVMTLDDVLVSVNAFEPPAPGAQQAAAALGALMLLARVSHARCRWRRPSG